MAPFAVEDDQAPKTTDVEQHTDHDRLEDVDGRKNDDGDPRRHQREPVEAHEDETMSDGASQVAAYEVLEMDVSVESVADRETTVELDVVTDLGDGSVFELDYVVEETMTEGRRTLVCRQLISGLLQLNLINRNPKSLRAKMQAIAP